MEKPLSLAQRHVVMDFFKFFVQCKFICIRVDAVASHVMGNYEDPLFLRLILDAAGATAEWGFPAHLRGNPPGLD